MHFHHWGWDVYLIDVAQLSRVFVNRQRVYASTEDDVNMNMFKRM